VPSSWVLPPGTFRISELASRAPELVAHPHAPTIIVLIAVGAFAKSAQAPLHVWLANAMVAPTPVSAYLHSATMVKLGVYLLARLNPVFGTHSWWASILVTAGLVTMLTGTLLALRESDLKRVLAYSTVVSLGTLITLIGLPAEVAAMAMVTFLMVHALYKACLFMVAGIIDHETGTRDASRLGGLARLMPLTAAVALLAGLSMAGLPPFVGYVGKELIYEAGLTARFPTLAISVAVLANACMVVVAGVVTVRCFFGALVPTPGAPHGKPEDPPWPMLLGPAVLSVLGLVLGLHPALAQNLLGPAARSVAGHAMEPVAGLGEGFSPLLALSVTTLVLGVLLLWHWHPMRRFLASRPEIDKWGPDAWYDRIMTALPRLANWQTRMIQQGSLRGYLRATFGITAALLFITLVTMGGFAVPQVGRDLLAPQAVLPVLLIAATLAVVRSTAFTAGIVAAGMTGFGLALTFLFNGAPDLAFTQFSVEALAIVLLLAIIGRMPFQELDSRSLPQRRRDAVVAAGLGLALSAVLMSVIASPFDERISDFFRQSSVPDANGRNLVNVIIVDFRALDTLGEITVLVLAALAVSALIISTRTQRNTSTHASKEPT
jgi:multicomponent Na+:H+ antiporter subunit A